MDYSIVVPVFNSENTLKELFARIQKVFYDTDKDFEVIFVEDAGTDSSWKVLQGLKKEFPDYVTAIKLTKNFGQHNATFCGLIHAKGDRVITIDDDLQTPPEEIKKLMEVCDSENADLVYGLYPVKKHSLMRNLWSSSLKITSKAFFNGPGKGSSFRLITKELAEKILKHHQNFIYLDELFNWYISDIASVNVIHQRRKHKRSGYSSFKLLGIFFNIMIYYSSVPLKMMIYTGFIVSLISFVIGLFYIIKRLFFNVSVPGYTSLIVAVLFSTGIILLSLGVIGEYLSRIYMVQNKKPPFSIKKNTLTMKISKYGIDLTRLTEEDIELVRQWRNSPQIRQYMEFREDITLEMQKKWFDSINNINNFYFIIHFEGQKIGLINSSNINWDEISSDGGIFLWEEKYYETFVPVWASLIELETTFLVFNATRSYIKTLKDNPRAIKLNTHLGYELVKDQEDVYNQQYLLTRENFIKKSKKIRKAAAILADHDKQELVVFYDKSEIESGFASFMEGKMDLGMLRSTEEAEEGIYYLFTFPGFSDQ